MAHLPKCSTFLAHAIFEANFIFCHFCLECIRKTCEMRICDESSPFDWVNFAFYNWTLLEFSSHTQNFKSLSLFCKQEDRHSLLTELSNLHFSAKLLGECYTCNAYGSKECHTCMYTHEVWQFHEIRKWPGLKFKLFLH